MIQLGKLIVDGKFFDETPSKFAPITDDDYGVRKAVHTTVESRRIRAMEAGTFEQAQYKRKIHRQAWELGWGEESFVPLALRDLLTELYETQRPFWIQADDEMTRCWGRCIAVGNDLLDPSQVHAYFTPTYPIMPYGHEPGDDVDTWSDALLVEGRLWDGTYTVNRELGIVLIDPTRAMFTHRTKVDFAYTWRAYVRIKSLELYAVYATQTYYAGNIVLEQVPIPIVGADLSWDLPPYSLACTYYSYDRIQVFGKLRVAGTANVPAVKRAVAHATMRVRPFVSAYRTGTVSSPIVKTRIAVGSVRCTPKVSAYSAGVSSQMLLPDADTNAVWTVTNGTSRWGVLSRLAPDETSYISGSTSTQSGTFSDCVDPVAHDGHVLTVMWKRLTTETTTLTLKLYQGLRDVAMGTFVASSDGTRLETYALTLLEAADITDYTDLRWQITATAPVAMYLLNMRVPVVGGVVAKTRVATGRVVIQTLARATRGTISASVGVVQIGTSATTVATVLNRDISDEEGGPL